MDANPILSAKLTAEYNVPLYYQLESLIRRCISSGLLKPGDMLPSEMELCQTFSISRSTVRQAIGRLEEEGLVQRHQGKGSFVAEPKLHRRTENIYSFTAEATAMGLKPSSRLLSFEVLKPGEAVRQLLELAEGTEIYCFTRIRMVDGVPLMLETSYYPCYIYPSLTPELLQTIHSIPCSSSAAPFPARRWIPMRLSDWIRTRRSFWKQSRAAPDSAISASPGRSGARCSS